MTVSTRLIMALLLWTVLIGSGCTAPSPFQPMSAVVDPVPRTSSIIVRGNDFLVAYVSPEAIIHIDLAGGRVRPILYRALLAEFPGTRRRLIAAYAHDKDRLYVTTYIEVPVVILPNDAIGRRGSLTFMLHVFDLKSATPIQERIIIKQLEITGFGVWMHGGKPVGMKLIPGGVRTLGREFFFDRPTQGT